LVATEGETSFLNWLFLLGKSGSAGLLLLSASTGRTAGTTAELAASVVHVDPVHTRGLTLHPRAFVTRTLLVVGCTA
jgi:hypothetical protein